MPYYIILVMYHSVILSFIVRKNNEHVESDWCAKIEKVNENIYVSEIL